jgi:hypothetical protein
LFRGISADFSELTLSIRWQARFPSLFPNPGSHPLHLCKERYLGCANARRRIGAADMAIHRWLSTASLGLVLLFAEPMARAEVADAALNLPDAPLADLPPTSAQTDAPAATGQSGPQTSPAPSKAPPLTPEEQRKKAQE